MSHTIRSHSAQTPSSGGRALARLPRRPSPTSAIRAGAAGAVLLWSLSGAAQTCPSAYSTCDNGGCCLSSEQCCPTLAEGCCGSATPYCCGDGTCAATPSQCNSARQADCDGYDVPCGSGCAPAGSDCCDIAGHYCAPESMCTSDTTCVRGAEALEALQVELVTEPETGGGGPEVAPPYSDPATATDRSCSLAPPAPGAALAPAGWLALAAALVGLRWRRGREPRRRQPRADPRQGATGATSGGACARPSVANDGSGSAAHARRARAMCGG